MSKEIEAPAAVLQLLMSEYELNPFSLSKAIKLSPSGARQLVAGKCKISVATALRLAKLFDVAPEFWLDLQREADMDEAANDKKLQSVLKGISNVKKLAANKEASAKSGKKTTLSDKRKNAAKTPGAKPAKGTSSKVAAKKSKNARAN